METIHRAELEQKVVRIAVKCGELVEEIQWDNIDVNAHTLQLKVDELLTQLETLKRTLG